MSLKIKDWFVEKVAEKFYESEASEYHTHILGNIATDFEIVKESEKAYLVEFELMYLNGNECKFGFRTWVPKSCTEDNDEYEANKEEKIQKGLEKNQQLVQFAFEHGLINSTKRQYKNVTLIKKIADAGLSI